jgi:hypothetical protein
MPAERPDPKVLAMLVAEYAHRDPVSNKLFLFDIFDGLAGPRLPVIPALAVKDLAGDSPAWGTG